MSEDSTRDLILKALGEIQSELSGVDERLGRSAQTVEERLCDTQPSLQVLTTQMEGVLQRLEKIEERLDHFGQNMDVLTIDVMDMRTHIATTVRRVDRLEPR